MGQIINEFLAANKTSMVQYLTIVTKFFGIYVFSLTGAYSKEYIMAKRKTRKIDIVKTLISSFLPSLTILAFYSKIIFYLNKEATLMFAFIGGYLGYNFLVTKLNNVNSFMDFLDHVFLYFKKGKKDEGDIYEE